LKKRFHFFPPDLDEWPDKYPSTDRGDSRKAPGPGAPEKPHDHRLGLIVGRMSQGNFRSLLSFGRFQKESVARFAGSFLKGKAFPLLLRADVHPAAHERNAQPGSGFPDKRSFFPRFRPKTVVQMGYDQGEMKIAANLPEGMKESHGVCSPGNTHHHPLPRLKHLIFLDRLLHAQD
jgi:hypothetical protein